MVGRTLNTLNIGESAVVKSLATPKELRRRFRDLGLIDGICVKCTGQSTHKDISSYLIKGAVIAIRQEDAQTVLIK